MHNLDERDSILSINTVEPALVAAVHSLEKKLGRKLKGIVLIHRDYADFAGRPKDSTGLFEEVICDFDNIDELQRVLKPYMNRILAVTCRYEDAIHRMRQVIPFVPYVHTPSETSLLWSTEKPLMRDRLSNYDQALTPRYQYMEEGDLPKIKELTKDFEYPLIVKPSDLQDALLVTQCNTEQELRECLERTFTVIHEVYARKHRPITPSVLVEEMMQGKMYSVDAYVMPDGEVFCLPVIEVVTGHSLGLPGFYTYRTIVPTGLSEEEIEGAFTASVASIQALNLRASTAHIELYRTPEGWKIVELGARIGGNREALYREAYGVEHFYNDLAVRVGIKPTMPSHLIRNASGMNIYAKAEGIIESIEGIEASRQLESVISLDVHAKAGDLALFANNGGQRVINAILSNKDAEQLERDVAQIEELINIRVKTSSTVDSRFI